MRLLRLSRLIPAAACLVLAACEGDGGPGNGPPAGVAEVTPAARSGPAYAALDSLTVRVVDASGSPLYNATVSWSVVAGGGSVSPASSRTDAAGIARTSWTLGGRLDSVQVVRATVGDVSVDITATATRPPGITMAKVSGDSQAAQPDMHLPQPLVVQVRAADGRPLQGVWVRWVPQGGSAELVGGVDSLATGPDGRVSAPWQTGCCNGAITALLPGASSGISFTVRILPGPPAGFVTEWPGAGRCSAGGPCERLVDSVVVSVVDRYGNPAPGATVSWSAIDGSVSPLQSVSDASGRARTTWTHATFGGVQRLQVSAPGTTTHTVSGYYRNPNIDVFLESPSTETSPAVVRFLDSLGVRVRSPGAASGTAYLNGAATALRLASGNWVGRIPVPGILERDTLTVWMHTASGLDSAYADLPFRLQRVLRVNLAQPLVLTGQPGFPTYRAPGPQVRIVANCYDDGLGYCQRLRVFATPMSDHTAETLMAEVVGTQLDQVVDFSAYAATHGKEFRVRVMAPGAASGPAPLTGEQWFIVRLP